MTEKLEAKQKSNKTKFKSQRTGPAYATISARPTTNQDDASATISVLKERQNGLVPGTALNQIRTLTVNTLPGQRHTRNQT